MYLLASRAVEIGSLSIRQSFVSVTELRVGDGGSRSMALCDLCHGVRAGARLYSFHYTRRIRNEDRRDKESTERWERGDRFTLGYRGRRIAPREGRHQGISIIPWCYEKRDSGVSG